MKHSGIQFLDHLDPSKDSSFNLETYTDIPKGAERMKPDPLFNRWPNLTRLEVEQLIPKLENLNELGAAIYVAVNQCEGQRSKKNILRVRGIHADLDNVSQKQVDAIRQRLKPTIEVQSSGPTNLHFYWLLDEGETLPHETAEALNAGLVEHLCLVGPSSNQTVNRYLSRLTDSVAPCQGLKIVLRVPITIIENHRVSRG